jgi:outer membrane protein
LASLLLYDGGSSKLNVEALKETVLATRQQLVSIEQQVLLRAVSAFLNVLSAREVVSLRQNNLRLLTQELRAAEDRFEVGEVTRTDVAQAEASLAGARSGLAGAQGLLQQANEEYRAAVGNAPGQLVKPPRLPQLEADVEVARARALRTHPDLLGAQHQVAAAELNLLRAEADLSPTVEAFGFLSRNDNLGNSDYTHSGSVGVELTAPIYRGGALSASIRRAIAIRDAERGNLIEVQRRISQDVGDSYAALIGRRASLAATEEQIKASEIAFNGVREEATLGARTTLDVLDAEQDLLDARTARISDEANLYVAAYSVLQATGRLTAQQLNLGVQLYDPAAYYNLAKDAPTALSEQGRQLDRVLKSLQRN